MVLKRVATNEEGPKQGAPKCPKKPSGDERRRVARPAEAAVTKRDCPQSPIEPRPGSRIYDRAAAGTGAGAKKVAGRENMLVREGVSR